jgi:hypothetical protein
MKFPCYALHKEVPPSPSVRGGRLAEVTRQALDKPRGANVAAAGPRASFPSNLFIILISRILPTALP